MQMARLLKTLHAAAICAAIAAPALVIAQTPGQPTDSTNTPRTPPGTVDPHTGIPNTSRDGTRATTPDRNDTDANRQTPPVAANNAKSDLGSLVGKLHQANRTEVQLGALAVAKAGSDDVADFGKQMVEDHTKADLTVMEFAREKKVAFNDPGKDAKHGDMIGRLEKLSGAEFDRAYVSAMTTMHDETVLELQTATKATSDADAKKLLEDLTSTVQGHQKDAKALSQKLGSDSKPVSSGGTSKPAKPTSPNDARGDNL
jgi:putative membrane protein